MNDVISDDVIVLVVMDPFILGEFCSFVRACFQVDSQRTLRNLRLQFAEQISLLAAERTSSSTRETLLRGLRNTRKRVCEIGRGLLFEPPCLLSDNRMERLIHKADQVLNSLSRRCGAAGHPAERSAPPFTQGLFALEC